MSSWSASRTNRPISANWPLARTESTTAGYSADQDGALGLPQWRWEARRWAAWPRVAATAWGSSCGHADALRRRGGSRVDGVQPGMVTWTVSGVGFGWTCRDG